MRIPIRRQGRDPPVARVGSISCRNLLIDLDAAPHGRVQPLFPYALRPGGYLIPGSSKGMRRETMHLAEPDRPARHFQRDATP